jgi:hypothetical protein
LGVGGKVVIANVNTAQPRIVEDLQVTTEVGKTQRVDAVAGLAHVKTASECHSREPGNACCSLLERETEEHLIVTFAHRRDGAGAVLTTGHVLDNDHVSHSRIGLR